jgi:nucleotide-binding universal stress UspA family protein
MHVIVATDGSRQSLAAAKHLKSFADPTKVTEISVVAVIRPLASVAFADDLSEGRIDGSFRDAAQRVQHYAPCPVLVVRPAPRKKK